MLVKGYRAYSTSFLVGSGHCFMWFAANSYLPAFSRALEAWWGSGSLGPCHDRESPGLGIPAAPLPADTEHRGQAWL